MNKSKAIRDLSLLTREEVVKIAQDPKTPLWKAAEAMKLLKAAKAGEEIKKIKPSELPKGWYHHLSGSIVAEILGYTLPRITQLRQEGMPVNDDGSYSLPAVIGYLRERDSKRAESPLKDEKTKAEIDILREKLQLMRDTMMLREDHKQILIRKAQNLRDMFLVGCRKYAHEFVGLKDATEAQDCLTQFVTHSLNFYAKAT